MTILTYNSAGLSVKDRLVISNLLGLFESRLNGKWVAANASGDQPSHVVLIDLDHPDGAKRWEAASRHGLRVAVTTDEPAAGPFISHPIRAFGPNGVVVLFNSLVPLLTAPSPDANAITLRDPARIRMTGRLEASPAPIRPIRPQPTIAPVAAAPLSTAPLPPPRTAKPSAAVPPPLPAPAEPVRRVAIQWGPPKPVSLPPLMRMPGARIHRFGDAPPEPEVYDFPLEGASQTAPAAAAPGIEVTRPAASQHTPSGRSEGFWRPPEEPAPRPLLSMPGAHRPVEIHTPPAPIIGRNRIENQGGTEPRRTHLSEDTPVLRSSPPNWKSPEAEPFKELIDFKSLAGLPAAAPAVPEMDLGTPEPAVNSPSEVAAPENREESLADTPSPIDVPGLAEAPEAPSNGAGDSGWFAATSQAELEVPAPLTQHGQDLQRLFQSLGDETPGEVALDAEADWWGTPEVEAVATDQRLSEATENSLFAALKAIKLSGQPAILEIPGLPAVCVIPARNTYLTTAPAARIELAAGNPTGITWRPCSSEAEARQLSGTNESRQASLEHLSWTASLLDPPADPAGMANQAVRLRRWPPITESRGRSKFLRYATLLSGAQATPCELAQITGDPVEEIVGFVNACSKMNLLEPLGSSKAPANHAPARTAGAGILRDMIEQLAPPKI